LNEANSERVIGEVRAFSSDHSMDFLVSRNEPDPGDFNGVAYGANINLIAMHTKAVGDGLAIFAVARATPSPDDVALAKEFACRVSGKCGLRITATAHSI
jgi:hypothetical protein